MLILENIKNSIYVYRASINGILKVIKNYISVFLFWKNSMSWFGLVLSESEKEDFNDFQKNRRPSMSVVGRGTLIMSLDDAHDARKEKNRKNITTEEKNKKNVTC